MTFKPDIDQIRADWDGLEDGERAVAVSTQALQGVCDGHLDPVHYYPLIEAAAEPQFDGPGGKPVRVLSALRVAVPALLRAESSAGTLTAPARFRLRSQPQVLLTRTFHLLPDTPREALTKGYTNLEFLIDVAEATMQPSDPNDGYKAACDLMRSPARHPLVQEIVAATGILMAVIRRNHVKPETRDRIISRCRGLVRAYILDANGRLRQDIVVYPKTAALAAQGFYLFKEHGQLEDKALIEALYRLDVATRPTHARAHTTCCLREMEYARFLGDLAAAERYRQRALVDLALLPRHFEVVQERGYVLASA